MSNNSRFSRLRKQSGVDANQQQSQLSVETPPKQKERGVVPPAFEGGKRPMLEREKRMPFESAGDIGTGAWNQKIHLEQNYPKTQVKQVKRSVTLPQEQLKKPLPTTQIPQPPHGVGYHQEVWNDRKSFVVEDEDNDFINTPALEGINPLSDVPEGEQFMQNQVKVAEQTSRQEDQLDSDVITEPGQYIVMVDGLMDQICTTTEQVRGFIEYLTFQKDISIKTIHVYKHLELDVGVLLKE